MKTPDAVWLFPYVSRQWNMSADDVTIDEIRKAMRPVVADFSPNIE